MFDLSRIGNSVVDGDEAAVQKLTKEALAANVSANEVLSKGLVPGLQKVGDLFEKGEFYLPELIISGDAASKAVELLEPVLARGGTPYVGRYVIGTVQGDVHNLGKDIVVMMLKGNGWEVTDLGVDVSPEEFCAVIAKGGFQILGMSTLLTMTMPNAARTIEALKTAGLRNKVKVMVGGAPTTSEWAEQIGADAHAKDGPTAAKVAAALVRKS